MSSHDKEALDRMAHDWAKDHDALQARVAELEAALTASKDDANKCHAWGRQITLDWEADRNRLEAEVEKLRDINRDLIRTIEPIKADRDRLAEALQSTGFEFPAVREIIDAALEGKAE
jgi:chromosome segregation ATPase